MKNTVNLFDLRPRRNRPWELTTEDLAVVLVPRFERGPLARWLMPRLARPQIRVKLDSFGTFVWRQCDGETTVAEISDRLQRQFGASAEPVDERLAVFIKRLKRENLLSL